MLNLIEFDQAFFLAYEDDAKLTVTNLLQQLPEDLSYHAAAHTLEDVYPEAMILAKAIDASEADYFDEADLLIMAVIALYHDVGFVEQYQANEVIAAQRARDYAQNSNNYSLKAASQIIYDAILNTNMHTAPKNKFERVIRDADLARSLGSPNYLDLNKKLRSEILQHADPTCKMYLQAQDDRQWAVSQLHFIKAHRWFTPVAQARYQAQQEMNIKLFEAEYADVLKSV